MPTAWKQDYYYKKKSESSIERTGPFSESFRPIFRPIFYYKQEIIVFASRPHLAQPHTTTTCHHCFFFVVEREIRRPTSDALLLWLALEAELFRFHFLNKTIFKTFFLFLTIQNKIMFTTCLRINKRETRKRNRCCARVPQHRDSNL